MPVVYGEGVAERIKAASSGRVDAFIDAFGGGYVEMSIKELGVEPECIDTIADFQAANEYGVKGEGMAAAASAKVLGELVAMISEGRLDVPIEAVYPLKKVRDAYQKLEQRHTLGKIVLRP